MRSSRICANPGPPGVRKRKPRDEIPPDGRGQAGHPRNVDYIRSVQQSPQNAQLVAKRLKAQFAKLVEMPHLGHVREELADDHALAIAVTGVLVIYDPWLKPLTILRVVHGARHLGRIVPRP